MKRTYRFILGTAFLSLLGVPQVQAQLPATASASNSQTGEVPKIVSRSELVLVPAVVTDKHGAHIPGLGKDAFRVEENGKAQNVAVFEEVKTDKADAGARPAIPPDVHSNYALRDSHTYRMTIVMLDMVNTPFLRQGETKRQLIKYLSKSLTTDEPTTLLGLNRRGLHQLHPYTTDTRVLIAALQKARGEISKDEVNDSLTESVSDMTADLRESTDATAQQIADFIDDQQATMVAFYQRDAIRQTLAAMQQIAKAYAAIPGRKSLIWASGGFSFMLDDPQAFARMGTDMVEQYESTWRTLVSANIAVYPIDANGLTNSGFSSGGQFSVTRRGAGPMGRPGMSPPRAGILYDKSQERQVTMRAFAQATGGTACMNMNDLAKCFAAAVDDSRSYYLLGFYLAPDDRAPGWRKLKVKVSTDGAHIRAREGFYVASPEQDNVQTRNKQMGEALGSPLEFTGLPMNIKLLTHADAAPNPASADGKIPSEFVINVPATAVTIDRERSNGISLMFVAVALGKDGKVKGEVEHQFVGVIKPEMLATVMQTGISIKGKIEVPAGSYDLHVALRDDPSGRLGTVNLPLEVK